MANVWRKVFFIRRRCPFRVKEFRTTLIYTQVCIISSSAEVFEVFLSIGTTYPPNNAYEIMSLLFLFPSLAVIVNGRKKQLIRRLIRDFSRYKSNNKTYHARPLHFH